MAITLKSLSFSQQLKIVASLFVFFSLVELANVLTGRALNNFGNVPRYVEALPGILFSPFLHGSIWHFLSNIVPLCIFSFLLLQYGARRFVYASVWIIVLTGILVWLFGRHAMHIGASGLVYGYFAFLLLAGFLSKRKRLIVISLLVGFFYGGMIFGVLPGRPFISWESHLFGFLAGLIVARTLIKTPP